MRPTRALVLIWFAWAVILIGFQALAVARLQPEYPDRAQDWTTRFTGPGYQEGHVYLLEPFMNAQVAWDSEYYLSIAIGGYDDPRSPHLTPQGVVTSPEGIQGTRGAAISSNYAFFPFYPLMIRLVSLPLGPLGMNPIATATLAGVIVSALGALLGMLALFDLAREPLGGEGGLRAAFYLIIFPTGFFLLQVYSEGLFVGLAFASLAMLRRGQWLPAALLAMAAAWTRATGAVLALPMAIAWYRAGGRGNLRALGRALLALAPLLAYAIWRISPLGQGFDYIQDNYYHRGFLSLGFSLNAWLETIRTMMRGGEPQHTAYYLTEFLGLAIGLLACAATLRTDPELGWFSLAVLLLSFTSGPAQGIHRYILGAPAVFVALARWGAHPAFDRAWTLLSILLMGLLAMLFAFNMWVA